MKNKDIDKKVDFYNNVEKIKLGIDSDVIDCRYVFSWDAYDDNEENPIIHKRDPNLDVDEDSVVAIDFGTKSTTAVILNDKGIRIPIKIGNIANGSKNKLDTQYENPTILLFENYKKFKKEYNSKKGRPYTDINDVKTSWFAYDSNERDEYNSFSKIKQWTNTTKNYKYLRDKMSEIKLYNFLEKDKGDVDPIEIYAYYLGSFINSFTNKNRKIYLNYVLSYPVTFSDKIKESILESFSKGIKKSIPTSVLNNESKMKNFSVKFGCSEPQAYAITALEEFDIKPFDDEKIMYAVYDFGGGTTDYDYGLFYKNPEDSDYDYSLESIHSAGNSLLGGENIIENLIISTLVKKDKNRNELINKEILLEEPENYSMKSEEDEIFVKEGTQPVAAKNMRILSKIFRYLWEERKNLNDDDNEVMEQIVTLNQEGSGSSIIEMILYDKNNNEKDINIEIDIDSIKSEIKEKLKQGIISFWKNYRIYLKKLIENDSCNNDVKKYIFLSGNSTRSEIFLEAFEESFNKINIKSSNFKLYYPLGTKKAEEQIVNNSERYKESISPNLKTGVAYGILRTETGSYTYEIVERKKNKKFYQIYYRNKIVIPIDSPVDTWYQIGKIKDGNCIYMVENINKAGQLTRKNYRDSSYSIDENHYLYCKFKTENIIKLVVSQNEDASIDELDSIEEFEIINLGESI